MSTPNTIQHGVSKQTPRSAGTAFTPSASSPSRSAPSPAHLSAAASHGRAGKLPNKRPYSTSQTPMPTDSLTPTFLGGSSPPNGDVYGAGRPVGPDGGVYPRGPADNNTMHSRLGLVPGGSRPLNTAAIAASAALADRRAEDLVAQRNKLQEIADLIGTRWGYVSRENVERCAKRIGGLECVWVEEGRNFTIAASELVIDIEWKEEHVHKVNLSYAKLSTGDTTSDELGSEMLRKDLVGWDPMAMGYVRLEHFAANLRRLATTDQLGGDKVSCFEALQGIHSSLLILWNFEVKKEREREGFQDKESSELEVLSQRSGKPSMHSTRSIGLRIEYWAEKRILAMKEKKLHDTAIDIASHPPRISLWALEIGCETFDATQYPPIRISHDWISKEVMSTVPPDDTMMAEPAAAIDWQEPATLVLDTGADAMEIDIVTGSTQPNIRFVAKLDPPVTLPSKLFAAMFNQLGQPIQDTVQWITFLSLLFPAPVPSQMTSNDSKDTSRRFKRTINSPDSNRSFKSTLFEFTVYTQRDNEARTVYELPFSHPKQLVEILPYLRQWALFCQILRRSVGDIEKEEAPLKPDRGKMKTSNGTRRPRRDETPPSDTDSESDSDPHAGMQHKAIDITFSYETLSQRIDLECSFPLSSGSSKQMRFSIFPNARVEASSADESTKVGGMDHDHVDQLVEKAGKVLRLTEDLGTVAAWILTQN